MLMQYSIEYAASVASYTLRLSKPIASNINVHSAYTSIDIA